MKKILFVSLATTLILPIYGLSKTHSETIIFKDTSDLIDLGVSKASIKIAYEKAGCNYELVDEVASARKSQIYNGCTPQFQITENSHGSVMFAGDLDKNLACLKKDDFYKKLSEGDYGFKEFVESKVSVGTLDQTRALPILDSFRLLKTADKINKAVQATQKILEITVELNYERGEKARLSARVDSLVARVAELEVDREANYEIIDELSLEVEEGEEKIAELDDKIIDREKELEEKDHRC